MKINISINIKYKTSPIKTKTLLPITNNHPFLKNRLQTNNCKKSVNKSTNALKTENKHYKRSKNKNNYKRKSRINKENNYKKK